MKSCLLSDFRGPAFGAKYCKLGALCKPSCKTRDKERKGVSDSRVLVLHRAEHLESLPWRRRLGHLRNQADRRSDPCAPPGTPFSTNCPQSCKPGRIRYRRKGRARSDIATFTLAQPGSNSLAWLALELLRQSRQDDGHTVISR